MIILIHAWEKYALYESSYVFFVIAGVVFLLVALLHHRIAKLFSFVDGVFYVTEAAVYMIIAIDYFHLGKKALPWAYVLATIGYLVAAVIKGKKGSREHRRHHAPNISPGTEL
ncbi:MAG: hypothetical protein ABIR81_04285 [Ginsengibacter sp.]